MTNNRVDKMGDDSALRRSLKEKNDFFKRMVNLIPAKYYLDKETKRAGERFFKNMKEEAPRQQLKEKSTKLSRKKQRLDPNAKQDLQVTDLQDALAKKDEEQKMRREEKIREEEKIKEAERKDQDNDDESSGDEMGGLEGELQDLGESDDKDWSQPKVVQPVSVERIQSSASIDDLRRKVQEKIEQLRQKRQAKSVEGNAMMSKKMAKKVKEANEKKLRKQETYEAIKASKEQKRKEKERQRTQNESQKKDGEGDAEEVEDEVQEKSKVSFSKFDFDEESRATTKGKKRKKKRKGAEEKFSGRDYEGLLKKVQAKKQKIAEVKKSDPEAAEELIKQDKWRAALDRAEGKKVRDDPELLKKSIRKKKEKKKHSEKKWTDRKDKTKQMKEERQKKRRVNLKGRTDSRNAKKLKRLQKKGKLLLKDSDYS